MQPTTRSVLTFVSAALLSAILPAQTGTVYVGTAPFQARLSSGWTRSLAIQPNGAMWCLAWDYDLTTAPAGRHLFLYKSTDQGTSWTRMAETPTIGDGRGAIAVDRGCDLVHVSWHGNDTGTFHNLYYQAFDTLTNQWVATPDILLAGTTTGNQCYTNDIAVTDQGTIGITFNTNNAPATIPGFAAWSGGIFVKRTGDTAFQPPFRCNTDSYGMLASLQAIGETFHLSFRTNAGLYGIKYRAFDSVALQWLTAADVPIYGGNQANMRAANSSCIASDDVGNLYILYSVGPPNPAGGALEVAFASAASGYSTWTTSLVETDSGLTAGNVTYQHFSLARGDGGTMFAVFAKASENYQNLYARILSPDPLTGGAAVLPDPALAPAVPLLLTTEANSFDRVDGLRAEAVRSGAMVCYSGLPASRPDGYIDFLRLGSAARTLEWGTACQSSLTVTPRFMAQDLPAIGTTFHYGFVDAPPNAPGIVFVGFDCLRPPFDLGLLGFTNCRMFFTPVTSSFVLADPAGTAVLPLNIPGTLGGGFQLQFGALLLAPGANPGGAVSTNVLSASVH